MTTAAATPLATRLADSGPSRADPAPFVRLDARGRARLELSVKGAKCAACIAKIERGLLAVPGVEDARLNLGAQRLTVTWRGAAASAASLIDVVERLGFAATPFDPEKSQRAIDAEGRRLLWQMVVAGFGAMNVMMFSVPIWAGGELGAGTRTGFYWISALIAIPCALYAGQPFFASAWRALRKGRANMDVPISIGVLLTLAVSISETALGGAHAYFDGVVMLLFLLLIGRWLDHSLRERARTAAKDLLALQSTNATRLRSDGATERVAARDVAVGDVLLLAAGERVAVDGVVLEGASEVDRALVTGESAPVAARVGDTLHAGVVNLTRPLRLRATAMADTSLIADLARLIEAGEQRRGAHVRLADKAAALYVPIVHTLAFLTFAAWMLVPDASWRVALMNAAAVLIVTCPCALGLAAPAVQVVATGRLFKRGVLVKSGDALERLARIDTVVLDKTGTLTLGRPRLVGAVDEAALAAAAQLARVSRHPLSRALVEAAGPGAPAAQAREIPGCGVEGEIAGAPARLGRRTFVDPQSAETEGGETELWFARAGAAPVRFVFADAVRPDAAATVAALRARGLAVELLSGDRPDAVEAAARAVGIDIAAAARTPAQKIEHLEALRAQGRRVLMVGDGLNDAAALAAADASASPAAAVDATQAAADVVLQGEELGALVELIDVARSARARVLENFAFAAVYNAVAVPAAALGFVTPFFAALAMAGSSLAVTLNALRLSGRGHRGKV
ncbi:MAG: cadmium-translocating P-type ATPase [Alphaproteobacteria bacterium]|nr:cadmium-translocating P-type ATPase [Alphaproteobacteria bacterium]